MSCEHELTEAQVRWLLSPIEPHRVLKLTAGSKASYVAQHDDRAHMIRIWGFAGWSTRVTEKDFVFDEQVGDKGMWKACYTATVRIGVNCSVCGVEKASYEDCHATGDMMPQPNRGDAHALALTTAVSSAFKRACTNLGDQFALSLYNKGQTAAFVKGTLVGPVKAGAVETVPVAAMGEETDQIAPEPDYDTNAPTGVVDDAKGLALAGWRDRILSDPAPGIKPGAHFAAVMKDALSAKVMTEQVADENGEPVTIGALINRRLAEVAS